MDDSLRIAELIYKSTKGELTPNEEQALNQWLAESPENEQLMKRLQSGADAAGKVDLYQQTNKDQVWVKLSDQLGPSKTVPMFPARIWRYAAAILLPLLIGSVVWFFTQTNTPVDTLAGIDKVITPGVEKAILTLADGKAVELGKTSSSKLKQGTMNIVNESNTLQYSADTSSVEAEVLYNTLQTPLGSTYRLVLADGSKVMLNAGSKITYPVSFSEEVRQVTLEGEALFEVAHSRTPFVVSHEAQDIRVLGTVFNVSAYTDEPILTTLLEGSVRVETQTYQQMLVPGEQSVFDVGADDLTVRTVDTTDYTAWTTGKFRFNNESLGTVMKRLSRWYDFDYEFENAAAKELHFSGRVANDEPISSVLQLLEVTTEVTFTREDQMIIIQ